MGIKAAGFLASAFAIFYICSILYSLNTNGTKPQPHPKGYNQGIAKGLHHTTKKILFWTSWYGINNWRLFHGTKKKVIQCDFPCVLSIDRTNPLDFDALVFHGRDSQHPPKVRRSDQVYIMYVTEPPTTTGVSIKGDKFYNWTATYNRMSDIVIPLGNVTKRVHHLNPLVLFKLPQLTYKRQVNESIILWLVSNCKSKGKREQYVDMLKTYMKVDIHGGCSGKRCPGTTIECKRQYASTGKYKFYLAFENSACKDYITEKSYQALKVNLVPIVYGGLTAQDYVDVLPPKSFINVRDFKSPKHLADYLLYLDKNMTAYMEYHEWRLSYELLDTDRWCLTCNKLHRQPKDKTSHADYGKLWNPATHCDKNLIQKVLG